MVRTSRGESIFTPPLAGLVLSEFVRVARPSWGEPSFTPREFEILRLVAKGYAYR